jgi:hypothetical protein
MAVNGGFKYRVEQGCTAGQMDLSMKANGTMTANLVLALSCTQMGTAIEENGEKACSMERELTSGMMLIDIRLTIRFDPRLQFDSQRAEHLDEFRIVVR